MTARRVAVVLWGLAAVGAAAAADDGAKLLRIVDVAAPRRLRVGAAGELRLTYRAPKANVVAVLQAVEDLEGADVQRATRQREFGVVARAFGREAGELTVPLSFGRAGRKRVILTLVTDAREESEPAIVEIEAIP